MKESTKELIEDPKSNISKLVAASEQFHIENALRVVSEMILENLKKPEYEELAITCCGTVQVNYEMAGLPVPKDIMDRFEEIMDEGKL